MAEERYMYLKGNIYYDTKDKVIVQHLGNRYVFIRHDRRTKAAPVTEGKREEDRITKGFIQVQGTLYFDKNTRQLYKKLGKNMVLYTKDRRKAAARVGLDRRKKQL
jgi:hypothetical protein